MGFGITHIRHAGLFSSNIADHGRFYSDVWGLQTVAHEERAVYLRGSSREFFLLSLHPSRPRGIHHIAFGMENRRTVDDAARELRKRGIHVLEEPRVLDEPGGGYGLRFVDPDGRRIELSSDVAEHDDGWTPRRVEPSSICHVVLNTPDI